MPRTIEQIDADIAAIKAANPNWASNDTSLNAITAFTNEKNQLTQSSQALPAGKDWFAMMPDALRKYERKITDLSLYFILQLLLYLATLTSCL